MKKLAYIIRVITVPPFMALVMLLVLFINSSFMFGKTANFILIVLFLVVFPMLAYPLWPLIKKYKDKGRDGQRTLAIIFSVSGYILGFIFGIVMRAPISVLIIYISYMISGLLIMLFNKIIRFKASGHACGVAGPYILLANFGQSIGYYIGIPVLGLVYLASLYMKRHSLGQLITGTAIPVFALLIVLAIH